ncbi:Asp-tRNA(Asn)/Glu-tRNA(Gln) amidotransferase subunit GatC [Candidatus Microgenomates bacterium]|nr:Asp-tRNA(Asn)/Glu-tRNA(Gln) amidotransferase subunit GatC [Candidatus Microgenomates bacterium]
MAKITADEVRHLAVLARMALTADQTKRMTKELEAILGYVAKLQAVDTKNVEPTSQVTGLKDIWRKDEVKPCPISRKQLLANAPQTKDGFIKVPRIL